MKILSFRLSMFCVLVTQGISPAHSQERNLEDVLEDAWIQRELVTDSSLTEPYQGVPFPELLRADAGLQEKALAFLKDWVPGTLLYVRPLKGALSARNTFGFMNAEIAWMILPRENQGYFVLRFHNKTKVSLDSVVYFSSLAFAMNSVAKHTPAVLTKARGEYELEPPAWIILAPSKQFAVFGLTAQATHYRIHIPSNRELYITTDFAPQAFQILSKELEALDTTSQHRSLQRLSKEFQDTLFQLIEPDDHLHFRKNTAQMGMWLLEILLLLGPVERQFSDSEKMHLSFLQDALTQIDPERALAFSDLNHQNQQHLEDTYGIGFELDANPVSVSRIPESLFILSKALQFNASQSRTILKETPHTWRKLGEKAIEYFMQINDRPSLMDSILPILQPTIGELSNDNLQFRRAVSDHLRSMIFNRLQQKVLETYAPVMLSLFKYHRLRADRELDLPTSAFWIAQTLGPSRTRALLGGHRNIATEPFRRAYDQSRRETLGRPMRIITR